MGTGPFVFERWQRGSHVLLKRNPAYWAAGRPLLDQVVFKFVPDPAAAALETGAVDVAGLLPSDLDRVAKLPQIAVDVRTDGYLNNMETLEFNLDSPYLRNLRVRQAIAHAIDKEFIRKAVFDGRFESLSSPIPKVLSRYYAPAERQYAYDVQEANRLLDAAGFPRKGGGERFALTIYFYPGSASFRATAEYIKAALARVGIRVTVQTADMALLTRRVYTERQFDLNINGVGALYDPTVGVQRHYWSTVHGQRVPFNNASGYANPEVGELFRKVAEEADEDRRAALLRRFQQIVGEEIPLLPLIALQTVSAQNRRVHRYYNSIDLTAGDLSDAWVDEK
ncbi:MAG: Heme-binding protein A [Xylophilus sp.]|nr:MAG: Heme-binding protein A [Xylophilus sp.]